MSVQVKTHPVMEAVAKELSGIGGVPLDEQRKMVARAAKVAAKMYDELYDAVRLSIGQHSGVPWYEVTREDVGRYMRESLKIVRPNIPLRTEIVVLGPDARDGVAASSDAWEEKLADVVKRNAAEAAKMEPWQKHGFENLLKGDK